MQNNHQGKGYNHLLPFFIAKNHSHNYLICIHLHKSVIFITK
nr:MAG TPA: hypothetical protein [Caudoviricetes sp.]